MRSSIALILTLAGTGCTTTAFEHEHARAEARNPKWLRVEIDTDDGRHTYRESEYITILSKYSSVVPGQYKIDIDDGSSRAAASDVLHLSDGSEIAPMMGIVCCQSRLIGLNDEPYSRMFPRKFRLKPANWDLYLTTSRVFPWETQCVSCDNSEWQTASNLLRLRILSDPGWQGRLVDEVKKNSARCGELSALDVPAATEEKLNEIRNGTCSQRLSFNESEYADALPAMEQIIKDSNYGVTPWDLLQIRRMRIWSIHPELRKMPNRKEDWEKFNSIYWSIATIEGRRLAVELCASAQQKTANAKRITVQSLGRESGLSPCRA